MYWGRGDCIPHFHPFELVLWINQGKTNSLPDHFRFSCFENKYHLQPMLKAHSRNGSDKARWIWFVNWGNIIILSKISWPTNSLQNVGRLSQENVKQIRCKGPSAGLCSWDPFLWHNSEFIFFKAQTLSLWTGIQKFSKLCNTFSSGVLFCYYYLFYHKFSISNQFFLPVPNLYLCFP